MLTSQRAGNVIRTKEKWRFLQEPPSAFIPSHVLFLDFLDPFLCFPGLQIQLQSSDLAGA